MGTYTHIADSYHVYSRHFELVNKMISEPFKDVKIKPIVHDNLVELTGDPSEATKTLWDFANDTLGGDEVMHFDDDIIKWIYNNLKK